MTKSQETQTSLRADTVALFAQLAEIIAAGHPPPSGDSAMGARPSGRERPAASPPGPGLRQASQLAEMSGDLERLLAEAFQEDADPAFPQPAARAPAKEEPPNRRLAGIATWDPPQSNGPARAARPQRPREATEAGQSDRLAMEAMLRKAREDLADMSGEVKRLLAEARLQDTGPGRKEAARSLTVAEAFARYSSERLGELRTGQSQGRTLSLVLKPLRERPCAELREEDIAEVVAKLAARAPAHATSALRYLSPFFGWAMEVVRFRRQADASRAFGRTLR